MKKSAMRILIFVLGIAAFTIVAAIGQDRNALEKERTTLSTQIKKMNSKISSTAQNRKNALGEVKELRNAIAQKEAFLDTLSSAVETANHRIKTLQNELTALETASQKYESAYQNALRQAYRQHNQYQQQSIEPKDWLYLHIWRHHQGQKVGEGRNKKQQALHELSIWQDSAKTHQQRLAQQQLHQELLASTLAEKNKLAQELKQKERSLKDQLKRKRSARQKLNNTIEEVIQNEMAATRNASRSYQRPGVNPNAGLPKMDDKSLTKGFAASKGKLPFPVSKGKIVGWYGKRAHPVFEQVQMVNNGVDIRASGTKYARSVYQGVVVSVFSIPGFHYAVMLKHGSYYTTYSNLEKVSVKRGDKVNSKQNLGTIYKDRSTGTYILHFELWKGKNKTNPSSWLK